MSKGSQRRKREQDERRRAKERLESDLREINSHRSPIALHIRRKNQDKTERRERKDAERQHKRAMAAARHPERGRHVAVTVVVIAFVIIAVGSIAVGNRYARPENANQNMTQASMLDITPTSREQRDVIAMSGAFDTFEVNGIRQSVFDGDVTSDEYATWSDVRSRRDTEKAQEVTEASGKPDTNDNEGEANVGISDGENVTSFNDGNATPTGTLTSEQEEAGRNAVTDALNQYEQGMSENVGD